MASPWFASACSPRRGFLPGSRSCRPSWEKGCECNKMMATVQFVSGHLPALTFHSRPITFVPILSSFLSLLPPPSTLARCWCCRFISLGASLTSGWCSNFCFQMFVFIYCILLSIAYIVCHCACGMNASPGPLCAGGTFRGPAHGAPPAQRRGKANKGALPAGWRSAVDPASGQVYYSHSSGVTQWTRP